MENKLSNEDKKNLFLINSFNKRVKIITYIYQFELFDEKVNVNEIFNNNDLNNFEVHINHTIISPLLKVVIVLKFKHY